MDINCCHLKAQVLEFMMSIVFTDIKYTTEKKNLIEAWVMKRKILELKANTIEVLLSNIPREKKITQLVIIGFPTGDIFSTISFLLASAQTCQMFENDLATRKTSKETNYDLIARIRSAEHFNFKRYSIEREVL